MKQYRVTAEHFVPKGEQGYPDAHIDSADLARMKQLAGILVKEDYTTIHDDAADKDMPSPMGSNISGTGSEKRQIEKAQNIKPGTDEWFKLWFAKPKLTGEKPVGDAPASKVARDKSND